VTVKFLRYRPQVCSASYSSYLTPRILQVNRKQRLDGRTDRQTQTFNNEEA